MNDELPEWALASLYDGGDVYEQMTRAFRIKHDLGKDDVDIHWQKIEEEFEELETALSRFREVDSVDSHDRHVGEWTMARKDLSEEMVDVIHAIHLLGQMLDIDLHDEFVEKASYNLGKSTERDERGFITDDG